MRNPTMDFSIGRTVVAGSEWLLAVIIMLRNCLCRSWLVDLGS